MTATDQPYVLNLPDGRMLLFYEYDFRPGYPGDFMQPPEPSEVNINRAWWGDGGRDVAALTEGELMWLHDDADAYDALLTLCEAVEHDREYAQLGAED